jgi:class 3 adenylate cyclase
MSREFPVVRYADAEGVFIAYEVRGEGAIDLVRVPGLGGSLLTPLVDPVIGTFWDRFTEFSRFINFDRRGLGLSDPLVVGGAPPLEQQVADIAAVMDSVGSDRAAFYTGVDGAPVAILFAAMYPERVTALVLNTAFARMFRTDDYPIGFDPQLREFLANDLRNRWGDVDHPWGLEWASPSRQGDPAFRTVLARLQQVSASKSAAVASVAIDEVDVRDVLPLVQAPTLVLCGPDNSMFRPASEYLAQHIPHARLVLTPLAEPMGGPHALELADVIEEFVTGTRPHPFNDRVLATVLFTDIVGSTSLAAQQGDHAWSGKLDRHDAMVRAQLETFRGREISTGGDSFFATFDGPARAIRCAQAIVAAANELQLQVRAGIHTGECEVRGNDLAGIAVHVGARVAALASADEVLTTRTVRDLVAGSGINFDSRGTHELKGVPDLYELYSVVP